MARGRRARSLERYLRPRGRPWRPFSSRGHAAAEEVLIWTTSLLLHRAAITAGVCARNLLASNERLEHQLARGCRERGIALWSKAHVTHDVEQRWNAGEAFYERFGRRIVGHFECTADVEPHHDL